MIALTIALAVAAVVAIVEAVFHAEQARELLTERDTTRRDLTRARAEAARLREERNQARAEGDIARVRQEMNADLAEARSLLLRDAENALTVELADHERTREALAVARRANVVQLVRNDGGSPWQVTS